MTLGRMYAPLSIEGQAPFDGDIGRVSGRRADRVLCDGKHAKIEVQAC
jgi:hypothetical protein